MIKLVTNWGGGENFMKKYNALVTFKIQNTVIDRTINDVQTIAYSTNSSRISKPIEEFLKNSSEMKHCLSISGEEVHFDIQNHEDLLFIEFWPAK